MKLKWYKSQLNAFIRLKAARFIIELHSIISILKVLVLAYVSDHAKILHACLEVLPVTVGEDQVTYHRIVNKSSNEVNQYDDIDVNYEALAREYPQCYVSMCPFHSWRPRHTPHSRCHSPYCV